MDSGGHQTFQAAFVWVVLSVLSQVKCILGYPAVLASTRVTPDEMDFLECGWKEPQNQTSHARLAAGNDG